MAPAETEGRKTKKLPAFHTFSGTFTFRLIPTLITLVMMAGMIGLGAWQIQRLHWKENLIHEIQARMQEPQIDVGLSIIPPEDIPNMDYHPGRASGVLQNNHALYLNATSVGTGEGGYDLLTPLLLDGGRYLLVNRGWVPYSAKEQKPGERDQATGVGDQSNFVYKPDGLIEITGILRLPPTEKPWGRPANNVGKNEWFWVDQPAMAEAADVKEFMPYILQADDAPHDGAWPVGGQTRMDLPNHHLSYAITWFWLAFCLPFIYFLSNWRRDAPKKVEASEKPAEDKPE
jgi:surfeit locus 1 family protein